MSFLDKEGLRYFWQGVKKKFYNKSEIDSQRKELQKGIDDASKTGGVEVGTIVDWEDGVEIPEGWEIIETSIPTPDFSQKTQITLDTSTPYTVDEDAFYQIMGELQASTNGSKISVQADGKMFYYMWSNESMTNVAPVTPLKKGTVLTLVSLTTASIRIWKMPILKKKQIKKVSVTPIDPITGSIVDGTNIDDKATNTYSANVIDEKLAKKQNAIANPCYARSFGGGAVVNVNITFDADYATFMVITNNCEGFLGQVSTGNSLVANKLNTNYAATLGISYKFISGNTIQITAELYKRFTIISAYRFTAEVNYPTS